MTADAAKENHLSRRLENHHRYFYLCSVDRGRDATSDKLISAES